MDTILEIFNNRETQWYVLNLLVKNKNLSTRTFIFKNLLTSMYQFCILKAQFNTNNFVARKRSNLYWLPKHRMKIRTEAICTYFSGVFLFNLRDTDGKSPFLCSSEVRTFFAFMHLENLMTVWKWYDFAMIWARQRCGEIPG